MNNIAKTATVTLQTHNQNIEAIHRLVDRILGMAGCGKCGRLALLNVKIVGDPPPDLSKEGVIGFEAQGF